MIYFVFAVESLLCALTKLMLRRTYVGVAYGGFDPSGPEFSLLLPVSVCVSLLGAGSTLFGVEAELRNGNGEIVSMGSPYGIAALLLRTAQFAASIFWIDPFESPSMSMRRAVL